MILAAGNGSRLGVCAKPLLRVGGVPLGIRAADAALEAGTVPLLVLGFQASEVAAQLRAYDPELMGQVHVVEAPQWHVGLSASFIKGVAAVEDRGAQCCAVLLVDQPGIGSLALQRLLQEHQPGRITRGVIDSRPGHPVVFDVPDAVAAAAGAVGNEGARAYLQQHSRRVDLIDISLYAEDYDIDTQEDLARVHTMWEDPPSYPHHF